MRLRDALSDFGKLSRFLSRFKVVPVKNAMDVIKRDDSRFWYTDFSLEGERVKRSTKVPLTEPKAKAMAAGRLIEQSMRLKKAGALDQKRMERLVSDAVISSRSFRSTPFSSVVEEFLGQKKSFVRATTLNGVRAALKLFVAFLGSRSISRAEVEKWRDSLIAAGRAHGTVSLYLRKLSEVCKYGVEKGYLLQDFTTGVKVPRTVRERKVPVTADLVRKLLTHTPYAEWQAILRFGYYHGLRMGDACSMRWKYLDLEGGRMCFSPRKQVLGFERELSVPLHPEMWAYLKVLRGNQVGDVSELVTPKTAANYAKARHTPVNLVKRAFCAVGAPECSFHGLRHGFVTTLAKAGVSSDLRKVLTHHKDDDIHSVYTHFDDAQLVEALSKIPKL